MNNYQRRLMNLNIDKLIKLEDEVLECGNCYCRPFCETLPEENTDTCAVVRREWLGMEGEVENEKVQI